MTTKSTTEPTTTPNGGMPLLDDSGRLRGVVFQCRPGVIDTNAVDFFPPRGPTTPGAPVLECATATSTQGARPRDGLFRVGWVHAEDDPVDALDMTNANASGV
ncbi:hypothetical protein pneo_cds_781 [Pandoravirus neocaledonia]|uniref:Uncharacterized protein n=1 Tax=Pandoravirus neocaledonia TaxID=2107708 RepID=A0A2U7UD42_9VIRU|nr:hypothetical protein pneo_cds_781 [Pandoravirus neocaledonia]AVK76388.1 hypothetical protein pneo_cds_781 [Pandoravirus neocaledonia]